MTPHIRRLLVYVIKFCFSVALAVTIQVNLAAQDLELPDPTAESAAIQSQLEAVRGVEQLDSLRRRIDQLVEQNAELIKKLAETTERTKTLEAELNSVREHQQLKEARRRAVPQLRLVAQVRTEFLSQAEIEAGDRTYRVTGGNPFGLQLTDGQVVTADVLFLEDGTVEVSLPELESTHLLAFRPSGSGSAAGR